MKKFLATCIIVIVLAISTFFGHRYKNNNDSIIPIPYSFKDDSYDEFNLKAPILIVGDSLGVRLATFKKRLQSKISGNLSTPIKIQSFSQKGAGIHRTYELLRSLKTLPLIVIYLGTNEEFIESKFKTRDVRKILKNFKLFDNDYVQTALMVKPKLSRFIYRVVPHKVFDDVIVPDNKEYTDRQNQLRSIVDYKLFEATLNEIFKYTRKSNSLLIPIISPINLTVEPKKSCYGSVDETAEESIKTLKLNMKSGDYKTAYNTSKELALIFSANAQIQFLHAQVALKLNMREEAQKYFELAASFDCENWRGKPIYNAIVKRVTKKYSGTYLDFHQMLYDESTNNITFVDDLYPQDLYYEKLTDILAIKIRTLLKL